MKIDSYTFGSIVIDGKVYKKDLIIFPDRIIDDWWRKEGHSLSVEDLVEVIKEKPELLIIGTGSFGYMQIPLTVKLALKMKKIEIIENNTYAAVEIFNEQLLSGRKIAGAFHITC